MTDETSTKAAELASRTPKPCPFCGEEPILVGGTSWGLYGIECTCSASPSVTETGADEAIAAWNRRAHPEGEVREALEELVDAVEADGFTAEWAEEMRRHYNVIPPFTKPGLRIVEAAVEARRLLGEEGGG